ncbi:hypothetical protein M3Y94_00212300 [Aphelenchoides besseyi]|nr:hypothetical protein M3Y94_00212300 [Aphelenchoides besseyi]
MASTIFGVHLSSCLCFVWLLTVVSSAQTNYDEQYARLMFMLAAGAYSPQPETCINETSRLSAQPFQLYSQSNTNCDTNGNSCAFFVTFSPTLRQIVIIYRGTKSKKQLIQEFLQSLQPNVDFYGHGKVNRYFFRALNALWDSSTAILSDPTFRDYTVTFVGHSLGGALASLAAMRTVLERLRSSQQVRMYSFGQPRVGTYKFSVEHDLLVPESYRVVNRNDVVPHLPLCHVRPEVQRNDNDETTNEKDVDPDPDSESFNLAEAIKNPCDGTEAKKSISSWNRDLVSTRHVRRGTLS